MGELLFTVYHGLLKSSLGSWSDTLWSMRTWPPPYFEHHNSFGSSTLCKRIWRKCLESSGFDQGISRYISHALCHKCSSSFCHVHLTSSGEFDDHINCWLGELLFTVPRFIYLLLTFRYLSLHGIIIITHEINQTWKKSLFQSNHQLFFSVFIPNVHNIIL